MDRTTISKQMPLVREVKQFGGFGVQLSQDRGRAMPKNVNTAVNLS